MKYNVPERVLKDLSLYARSHDIEKIILFGSRAVGNFTDRSDVDIAVTGGDFDGFYWDVKEKTYSLLMFDIVDLDKGVSLELQEKIEQEGVVIYEKTR